MYELKNEIERLKKTIAEYEHVLPFISEAHRDKILFHREWDLKILSELQMQTAMHK